MRPKVSVTLNLDGTGNGNIETGVQFLDHMLNLFAKHGIFDLDISCKGDLGVDRASLGRGHRHLSRVGAGEGARRQAGIVRFAHAYFPMDEALARVVVDLSGRPYLVYNAKRRTGARRSAGLGTH